MNAHSSFLSPLTDQINQATRAKIEPGFIDLLEQIPASYLVIHNRRMPPVQRTASERFLLRHVFEGRLRFVNRFDDEVDLYAVVKNEPAAVSEAPLPIQNVYREWRAEIQRNPLNLLAQPEQSQTLYRILLTTSGAMPKYAEFLRAAEELGTYANLNGDLLTEEVEANLKGLTARVAQSRPLRDLDNRGYVERLTANTNVGFASWEQDRLIQSLDHRSQTRPEVLLKIANDDRLIKKEQDRSLLLLYYFAYLRRNPGDPPDRDLNGFNFWLQQMTLHHDIAKIATAFQDSIEFRALKER